MGLGGISLLIAADRADDGGTEMLRPLAENKTDAARRGMEQNRVAGFDAIGLADQILHRQALRHHCRGSVVTNAVGQLEKAFGRNQPLFGVGAERRASVGDAVPWLQIGDAGSDFLDHAGPFAAQAARQLHRIKSRAVVDVDKIQSHGGMADARLAGTGFPSLTSPQTRTSGPPVLWKRMACVMEILLK